MSYKPKYIRPNLCTPGRRTPYDYNWDSDDTVQRRDRYYAFLKHRAQAKHRDEVYELDFDDWVKLWPMHLFEQRGRGGNNLVLSRRDPALPWRLSNCVTLTRIELASAHGKRTENGNV